MLQCIVTAPFISYEVGDRLCVGFTHHEIWSVTHHTVFVSCDRAARLSCATELLERSVPYVSHGVCVIRLSHLSHGVRAFLGGRCALHALPFVDQPVCT